MELKTIRELHEMTPQELLSEALSMRFEIKALRGNLEMTVGFLEIACRPKDEAEH